MTTEQKQPSHHVYHRDDKKHAAPLGQARLHSDGKGYDIDIDLDLMLDLLRIEQ